MKEQFLINVTYAKQDADKWLKVKEDYITAAVSFTDAEKIINEKLANIINESFVIQSIKRENVTGFLYEFPDIESIWYKVKIRTQDPESEKVKFITFTYYVNAESTGAANGVTCSQLKNTFTAFDVVSITETKVVDRYP